MYVYHLRAPKTSALASHLGPHHLFHGGEENHQNYKGCQLQFFALPPTVFWLLATGCSRSGAALICSRSSAAPLALCAQYGVSKVSRDASSSLGEVNMSSYSYYSSPC